ncbi:hypothetical protein DL96DRAFT_1808988 [Flagelloscypha sp. PMI_526]|nr:hypothetical protein DL96DRAFT_1808988 [Flagelloscypha sp. PMI_526]
MSSRTRGRGRGNGAGRGTSRGSNAPPSRAPGNICNSFWSSGTCSRGGHCKFEHRQNTQDSNMASTSTRGRHSGPAAHDLPRNACNSFWKTGTCNHGFHCKFSHVRPEGADHPQSDPEDAAPDFFSLRSLVQAPGANINSNSVAKLSPGEVHSHLQVILKAGRPKLMQTPFRQEAFVQLFGSIHPANPTWNVELAQQFLDKIVNDETLHFIADILRTTNVSTNASPAKNLSFQRGWFPLLQFFASDLIIKSTMRQNLNKLYTLVDQNYDEIHQTILESVSSMIDAKTWKDFRGNVLSGPLVFIVIEIFLSQYIQTFKKGAFRDHPGLLTLIEHLYSLFETWRTHVDAVPPTFDDPFTTKDSSSRALHLRELDKCLLRLRSIARRECGVAEELRRDPAPRTRPAGASHADFLSQLGQVYIGPGSLRPEGPRHDNDFEKLADVRIAPTHEELTSPLDPYLPVFVPGAPHHLAPGSMEKHIDIQGRLLREEMLSEIRKAVRAIEIDLETMQTQQSRKLRPPTILEGLLRNRGGAYRTSGQDGVFFHLYTDISFASAAAQRRNFTVGFKLSPPPGNARHAKPATRAEFWEHSRRLSNGNLVILVLQTRTSQLRLFVGMVASTNTDIGESAKASPDYINLRISFFDPEIELDSLRGERIADERDNKYKFGVLIDTSVLFEAVRPFLRTLQNVEPTSVPFGEHIASESIMSFRERGGRIEPPRYARVPRFRFNLRSLFAGNTAGGVTELDAMNPESVRIARKALRERSRLDPSQADAIVDTLTREVTLIQGPPGTGKSFTGKEIIRVLFESKIKPIVLISFTNHALDHMLGSILDDKITNNIVRLGSRSSDERIAQFNLFELEKMTGRGSMDQAMRRAFAQLKRIEEEMERVIEQMEATVITASQVNQHLTIHHPEALFGLLNPHPWVLYLYDELPQAMAPPEEGGWKTVGKKGNDETPVLPETVYDFWRRGFDIDFLNGAGSFVAYLTSIHREQQLQELGMTDDTAEELEVVDPRPAWFMARGLDPMSVPPLPIRKNPRTKGVLLDVEDVWSMTIQERNILARAWEGEVRRHAYNSNLEDFKNARAQYDEACEEFNNIKDQTRKELLSRTDLIGCTTTGAAKLVSLLTAVSPKVLIVEEAGQILEAHTLASLVPSVEHMISIGDPQQLRPTLATFSLSVDSSKGRRLYKFDRSLMERLSDNGFPMSLINVQRRMRPEISRFPRLILYPNLEDHPLVSKYPPVQGMQQNVFFLTHTHGESGEKDSVSKYNAHEVDWICHLVRYFLKQGAYSGKGDVAVLCAYLGQLQQVRLALRKAKLAVTLNERDQEALERHGQEDDPDEDSFQDVEIARHIRLGTVDTFQGEEAKIVIISLVRNSGDIASDTSIGFLKIINRVNVALSRAQHGMYILGNASNLRQNETWSKILDDLESYGQIGPTLPVVCSRHPQTQLEITKPDDLSLLAPEGGCLASCGFPLQCGHICKAVCHPDLNLHKRMVCDEPCPRITCPRKHPCDKRCGEACGQCRFPLYNETLPCGHIAPSIHCYQKENLQNVRCKVKVIKQLPTCEHQAEVYCSQDVSTLRCTATCREPLDCCSKTCQSPCHDCQQKSKPVDSSESGSLFIQRTVHKVHPCERTLFCKHLCGKDCHPSNQACNDSCSLPCHQTCSHQTCSKKCSIPCPPCMEPCSWTCSHHTCPVPCGSVCARLPCNEPCSKKLACGHICPSVCGEICEQQPCLHCMFDDDTDDSRKDDIVDQILQRTLSELELESNDMSERIIALSCGHIFTVETLDGVCHMSDFYEQDINGDHVAMKSPPTDFIDPPVCPSCRCPISSPRYGRVIKRARLDILERNVAGSFSKSLAQATSRLEAVESQLEAIMKEAATLPKVQTHLDGDAFDLLVESRISQAFPSGRAPAPISWMFFSSSVGHFDHGFSDEESKAWKALIKNIVRPYRDLAAMTKQQSPHSRTYHASISTLYRQELHKLLDGDHTLAQSPEEFAMREADKRVGQPPHKADTRYKIDAYLLTVTLRLYMVQVARVHYDAIATNVPPPLDPTAVTSLEVWGSFMDFILLSCEKDIAVAHAVAEQSAGWRQMARCDISALRVSMERFKLAVLAERHDILRQGNFRPEDRETLVNQIQMQLNNARKGIASSETAYLRRMPSASTADLRAARQWFTENCRNIGDRILKEYEDFREYIASDKAYQPLSAREKEEIVKAFNFGYRGHWYNCENGHPFVITECGGAMQVSRCPECGATIGGSNHSLHMSNTRALEFEQISRDQGGQNPHWAWGQGA